MFTLMPETLQNKVYLLTPETLWHGKAWSSALGVHLLYMLYKQSFQLYVLFVSTTGEVVQEVPAKIKRCKHCGSFEDPLQGP